MIKDIKDIIDWTLKQMDMYSEDAADLIFRTGMVETGYKAIKQYGGGPALGFFQVEPETIRDTIENYASYRPKVQKGLIMLGFDNKDMEIRVMSNIALQVAFCRLKYRRDKNPLPKAGDLAAQARYWKRVYNTMEGKGTTEHFMEMNNGS
tara:strand:+ start:40 stop:489 length:450 start_codon:yes stop_codon:yes gene_type:complete